ncbi:MAG: hypothetical protein IKM61_04590 [Eubacteriaceae bacterium]|nr:hypothetical protein [Eubacteriaceae bacterium]
MARKPFDPAELIPVGENPPQFAGRPGTPIYARPISSRDNSLLFFEGKKPYWIPVLGFGGDVRGFRPRLHPDNVATHLVVDGEGPMNYGESNVATGWFGLEWVFVPHVGGATVKPGNPLIEDITEWRNITSIPNLDELDWEGSSKANAEYLSNKETLREVCTLSGLWERLISLMDVEGAAVALIDEDQKEGVHDFFSALCDMYDDMIARYAKYFDLDMLLMHDDWGTQKAPFFSLDTCREMIMPYLKRIVDACHRNGLLFELHCCGQNEELVPAMIEAGVDIWCGQPMNDYEKLSEKYPDTCLAFGVYLPEVPVDATEEDIQQMAKEYVERHAERHTVINPAGADPRLLLAIYAESRKYYEKFDE